VMTRDPRTLLPSLRAAGTIFLGAASSVAFGDYITGANHVLPTAGLARAYSGLSTADFVRWTTYQELSPAAAAQLSGPAATLADAEGLPAHALAARLRAAPARALDTAASPPSSTRAPLDGAAAQPSLRAAPDTGAAPLSPLSPPPSPLMRAAYASLTLYDPGRTPCAIDLSDNTSLFGPAPSVRAAIERGDDTCITRYPSVYADE